MNGLPSHCCTTPDARLSYAELFEPKPNLNGVPQYSVTFLMPKATSDLTELTEAMNNAVAIGIQKKWGGVLPNELMLPVKDGDVYAAAKPDKRGMYVGMWYLKASQNPEYGKPVILDTNRVRTTNKEDVQSGDYARGVVEFVAYRNKGKDGLIAIPKVILKIRDGERFGGGVSSTDAISALGGEVQKEVAVAAATFNPATITPAAVPPAQDITKLF